jgi:histone-lysine N-methyltransferase SETD2
MPLLHIIGLSPSNSSFSIAFCFMQNEQEESYKWTLKIFFSWLNPLPFPPVLCTDRDLALLGAIKSIYPRSPHLLCVWHINKNVLAKTKQYFSSNEEFEAFITSWKDLINSSTTVEYKDRLAKFETSFSLAPAALRYVKDTWLTYKEMFVRAWIGQYLHLGNWATSRVEGSHAVLKKHIGSSTGDVLFVFERINNALEAQHQILQSDLAEDQIKALNFCSHFLYSNITKRTSRYSLRIISEQASIAKRATPEAPLSNCTNIFTRTMGLPCAHRIATLLSQHQPIPLSDVHQFWRLSLGNELSEYLPILDPLVPPPPQRTLNQDTSDPRVTKKKAPPKCSNCGEIGHKIRSCRV